MRERYNTKMKPNMLSAEELTYHVGECSLNKRESQKVLYNSFYGYAMAICDQYISNQEDAVEMLNDGFLKIFREIHHYQPAYSNVMGSFKGWLRKIMIYTAIDHFRKNQKHKVLTELDNVVYEVEAADEDAIDKLSHKELTRAIHELTPRYRTVFNLFIIDGLSHDEISVKLGISTGTSKSNLSRAKRQLRKILFRHHQAGVTKDEIWSFR